MTSSHKNLQGLNEFLTGNNEGPAVIEGNEIDGPPHDPSFRGHAHMYIAGQKIRTFLSEWRPDKQSLRHLLGDMLVVQLRLYWVVTAGTSHEFPWPSNITVPVLPPGLALCIDPPLPPGHHVMVARRAAAHLNSLPAVPPGSKVRAIYNRAAPRRDPALLALKHKAEEIGNELVSIRKSMAMMMNRFDDLSIDLGHHEKSIADLLL